MNRDEKQQLLLGIRRANRQPANLSSSVLSSDSMHIGILAAAAHAAANNSPFTVFYNPRASPSEFVIPLAKYYKAVCGNQISLGMRFRMMFETEESGTRRYMGTITGISDLDPVRWKNSQWRNLQVGWDESTAGERRNRVSIWEIEPVTAPFFICPPPFFRSKRPRQPGMSDDNSTDFDNIFKKAAMPWLGDDIYMKDPQSLPGLSLVQWMNMQQNPSMANSMQPSCMQSLSGSVLQNLPGADLPHHLGFSAQHLPQPSNLQFNPQQPPQQGQVIDQLPRMPSPMNPLGAIMQSQQHQLGAILQQSTQNLVTPTIQSGQVQTQILQPQNTIQNAGMLQQQSSLQGRQLSRNCQSLPQQQNQQQNIMCQSQQPSVIQTQVPDQVNQHLQMSNNQIQHQLLQKLQQQQQSILAQQSLQPQQFGQLQDPQRQLLEASQSFLRPVSSNQASELPQMRTNPLPQSNITQQMTTNPLPQSNITQQMATNNSQTTTRFSQLSQQLKFQQPCMLPEIPGQMGVLPTSTIDYGTNGAGLLAVAEEIPSCSTSLSANNFVNMSHSVISNRAQQNSTVVEDMTPSASTTLVSTGALETMSCNANRVKDVQQRCDVKPSLNISKNQNQGYFTPQAYLNGAAAQTDYLDTSSSTTSVCVSQNNNSSYNQQSMLLRDTSQDGELPSDPRNNVSYKTNVDGHAGVSMTSDHGLGKGVGGLSKDFSNNLSGSMLANCQNSKDPQNELSSSIVSQSFGVPDMAFNSIDSTMNDGSFMNRGAWPPPVQRMRTYTKVYKRGAVGRSIDITRYSGYDELKQDLARRFGIEGQLEDRQRIGWKLVYVDHENDVLLVGDDPWEEFVNCVRCIKILSPQEVQQMSLDVGNSVLPNQACSSSDNGNT